MISNMSKFEKIIIKRASKLNKTIVLPEAEYSKRVLDAALICASEGVANVVLLAKSNKLNKYAKLDRVRVIDITTSELKPMLASALFVKRKEKGLTHKEATALVDNELYFATMMVELGLVDGMVAGAENSTANVLRPALQIIKTRPGFDLASSVIFMCKGDQVYAFADCALNINPDAEQLAQIVKETAFSVKKYMQVDPVVAMLSYSTNGSGKGESAEKVHAAVELMRSQKLDFDFDGEMQFDAAVDLGTRKLKYKDCKLKDKAVNAFVFPNLDSGNIGYKMLRFGGYTAIGPLMQGLRLPVNDISRGATAEEIVLIIAATAIEGE